MDPKNQEEQKIAEEDMYLDDGSRSSNEKTFEWGFLGSQTMIGQQSGIYQSNGVRPEHYTFQWNHFDDGFSSTRSGFHFKMGDRTSPLKRRDLNQRRHSLSEFGDCCKNLSSTGFENQWS
mmetsp:Transcript_13553/g.17850  ORF Transcript_13553/g.17850 Transcript_13553/m.17850 type:complete len:120 (+) Transcript_13553:197-556(+)